MENFINKAVDKQGVEAELQDARIVAPEEATGKFLKDDFTWAEPGGPQLIDLMEFDSATVQNLLDALNFTTTSEAINNLYCVIKFQHLGMGCRFEGRLSLCWGGGYQIHFDTEIDSSGRKDSYFAYIPTSATSESQLILTLFHSSNKETLSMVGGTTNLREDKTYVLSATKGNLPSWIEQTESSSGLYKHTVTLNDGYMLVIISTSSTIIDNYTKLKEVLSHKVSFNILVNNGQYVFKEDVLYVANKSDVKHLERYVVTTGAPTYAQLTYYDLNLSTLEWTHNTVTIEPTADTVTAL